MTNSIEFITRDRKFLTPNFTFMVKVGDLEGYAQVCEVRTEPIDVTCHGDSTQRFIIGDCFWIRANIVKLEPKPFLAYGIEARQQEFVDSIRKRLDPKRKDTSVKLKRFYIGKPEVVEGRDYAKWAKDSLPEAIEHAKQRAEETGEPQYVVKVIKVVRRKPQPIVVEDVK